MGGEAAWLSHANKQDRSRSREAEVPAEAAALVFDMVELYEATLIAAFIPLFSESPWLLVYSSILDDSNAYTLDETRVCLIC